MSLPTPTEGCQPERSNALNISALSDDLLKVIADHVLGDAFSKRVSPLLIVSKRWRVSLLHVNTDTHSRTQDAAEPAFYRALCFSNADSLQKGAASITAEENSGHLVACHIRILRVEDACDLSSAAAVDALITLIALAPALLKLRLPPSAPPSVLLVASRMCGGSLVSLIACASRALEPGLAHVNRLQGLAQLTITSNGAQIAAERTPAWTLPALRDLQWIGISKSNTEDVQFLERCRFAGLQSLLVSLPLLKPHRAHHLQAFLRAHPGLEKVVLDVSGWRAAALLPCVSARHLVAYPATPAPDVVPLLPLAISVLSVSADLAGDKLWPLLAALRDARAGLESVHVRLRPADLSGPFLWAGAERSADHAAFVGRLLAHAPSLHARGIRLVDEDGKWANISS
jgi:hypothetical protein